MTVKKFTPPPNPPFPGGMHTKNIYPNPAYKLDYIWGNKKVQNLCLKKLLRHLENKSCPPLQQIKKTFGSCSNVNNRLQTFYDL